MTKTAKTYRFDDSLLKELEVTANERGVSMTKFVEDAIQAAIHSDRSSNTESNTPSNTDDQAISALIAQLDRKDEQIARLDQRLAEMTAALRELNGTDALRLAASHSDNVEVIETVENIVDTANDSPDKADITIVEDEQAEQTLLERIRAFMARLFN